MERINEFLEELRAHWDDHYWWARHQALQLALLGILSGVISLFFTYLEARVRRVTEAA